MAYVAVKGGESAIEKSIELLKLSRGGGSLKLEVEAITSRMKQLTDRVMCEAGFYAPEYAAIALKQSEGSLEEAVFLTRAYRSTLPRNHVTLPLDCRDMRLVRRISSAFKDIPMGQILGATYDYTHRLIDFGLIFEDEKELQASNEAFIAEVTGADRENRLADREDGLGDCKDGQADREDKLYEVKAPRVSDLLRQEGIIASFEPDDSEPDDITRDKYMFPASRSVRLQTLFRADTGFISGVSYAGLRGYGFSAHPTIGELRCGYMEIEIVYPLNCDERVVLGEILFTEVESYVSDSRSTSGGGSTSGVGSTSSGSSSGGGSTSSDGSTSGGGSTSERHDELGIAIGYGLAFGRAETRAIAMSILDCALNHPAPGSPPNDEEFVLLHGEALEMSGFISHLKLPHYVTYQSKLDNIRKTRREGEKRR